VRRAALALLSVVALGGAPGCGGGDGPATAGEDTLLVSAASSLTGAFERYAEGLDGARVRLSFAGSDELAAQIRQGLRPDVFAAANTALPQALAAEGLVEEPVVFAGNRLVLAVPADSEIERLGDAGGDGVRLAVGAPTVPVGAYTRAVLDRLDDDAADAILANVRSAEPAVTGILAKLTQGAVDAGFVYATDVRAAGDALRAVALPDALDPVAAYAVAVVRGGRAPAAARAFVAGLLDGDGAAALRSAGFTAPPTRP
jgi:molybdate transport system substrate-binding protein